MSILNPSKYDQVQTNLSEKPAAILPMSKNMDLLIFKCKTGYNLFFEDIHGTRVYAGQIEYAEKPVRLKKEKTLLQSAWFRRCITTDTPFIHSIDTILTPADSPAVYMRPDGTLYCRNCHCTVPNTANDQMRKDGVFAHSHICGVRAPGEIYEEDTDAHAQ